jgi:hypothetical protein
VDEGLTPCCGVARVLTGIAIDSSVPIRGATAVLSTPQGRVQCHPAHGLAVFFAAYLAIHYLFLAIGGVITLCGFPCNSDSLPPLMCDFCYEHRRQMVHALGADESRFCTRVKATFCCYCSDVKASGVWPGQLCCTASQSDREYMARAAVRGRYSVESEYAVEATSPAGARLLARLRGQLWDAPAPMLCYRMK